MPQQSQRPAASPLSIMNTEEKPRWQITVDYPSLCGLWVDYASYNGIIQWEAQGFKDCNQSCSFIVAFYRNGHTQPVQSRVHNRHTRFVSLSMCKNTESCEIIVVLCAARVNVNMKRRVTVTVELKNPDWHLVVAARNDNNNHLSFHFLKK